MMKFVVKIAGIELLLPLKLKQLQQFYPNLTLSVITVVNEKNFHCYPAFVDELVDTFKPNQIAINLFRNTTLDETFVTIRNY